MYTESDLVRIAKRDNNKKRNYLVVNRLQGKHIPASPKNSFEMFFELAEKVKNAYPAETLLLIGFAETATAIGAAVASCLDGYYIQTTRENIEGAEYLYFEESHSHATEQKLVKNDLMEIAGKVDRIVFVEDEITTGNTILKIVTLLRKFLSMPLTDIGEMDGENEDGQRDGGSREDGQRNGGTREDGPRECPVRFAAASILNGMIEEYLQNYQKNEIELHYLVKTDHDKYIQAADDMIENGICHTYESEEFVQEEKQPADGLEMDFYEETDFLNARCLVGSREYAKACEDLAEKIWNIRKGFSQGEEKKILVLGTEECMYPGLCVAKKFQEMGQEVRFHATTRSPILPSKEKGYPLSERFELRSFYDPERITYIYDLKKYDEVYVVTDAKKETAQKGASLLVKALREVGNHDIRMIFI